MFSQENVHYVFLSVKKLFRGLTEVPNSAKISWKRVSTCIIILHFLVLSTYHIQRVHFTKLPRKKLVPLGRQIKELLEQKQYETIHFISVIIIENVKNGWTWGSGRKTIVPWLEMIICLVQVLYYIGLLVALFQLWHCLGQQFSLEFKLVCRPGKITSFTLTKLLRKYVPGVEDR